MQWIGIPVTVGIDLTKTLAKIANHIAKKDPSQEGDFDISDKVILDDMLSNIEVEDVWG